MVQSSFKGLLFLESLAVPVQQMIGDHLWTVTESLHVRIRHGTDLHHDQA